MHPAPDLIDEPALRRAYATLEIDLPFDAAMQQPALAALMHARAMAEIAKWRRAGPVVDRASLLAGMERL